MCNKVLFAFLAAILTAVLALQPAIAQQPDPESPTKLTEKVLPQGVSNSEAEPVTPGMFYEGYSNYIFQPYTYDNTVDISGCIYRTAASTFGYVAARLQLPQGALVKEVTLYLKDNTPSTTDGISLSVTRNSYMMDSISSLVTVDGIGLAASPNVRRVVKTLSPPLTIDNSQYAYTLIAQLTATGSSLQICGARVGYTFSSSTPLVVR